MDSTAVAPPPAGPLALIKKLDFAYYRAGPTCVRVLADFGADVIQIVRPETRPRFELQLPEFRYANLRRIKRSVAINFKPNVAATSYDSWLWTRTWKSKAFVPTPKATRKVDYETLSTLNPRIVLGSISGFGQDWGRTPPEPVSTRSLQGLGGLMSVMRPVLSVGCGAPCIAIADLCAGMFLAHGTTGKRLSSASRPGRESGPPHVLAGSHDRDARFSGDTLVDRRRGTTAGGQRSPDRFLDCAFPVQDGAATPNIARYGPPHSLALTACRRRPRTG